MEVGNGFGNVAVSVNMCVRDRVVVCACVLFGGTKLVFVAAGILSGGPSEGSRGSGYRPSWLLMPSYLFLTHTLLVLLSRPAPAYLETAPLDFFFFFFGGAAFFFFLSFVFFFLFYVAHPLTRAAGQFQHKCDTNSAIQI